MTGQVGRIPSGRFRELGPINWVIAKLGARDGSRAGDASVHNAGSAPVAVLGVRVLRRPPAARPVATSRHRAGDPAGRAPAQFGVRAAASPLDRSPSGSRRPDPGADLRLAEHVRKRRRAHRSPAGTAACHRRIHPEPVHRRRGVPAAVPSPRSASAHRILLTRRTIRRPGRDDVGPADPAGSPGAITSKCRPAPTLSAEPAEPATRTRTPPA